MLAWTNFQFGEKLTVALEVVLLSDLSSSHHLDDPVAADAAQSVERAAL